MAIKIQKGGGSSRGGSSKKGKQVTIRKSKAQVRQMKRRVEEEVEEEEDWEPEPASMAKIITWSIVLVVLLGGAGAGGWFAYGEYKIAVGHRSTANASFKAAQAVNAQVDAVQHFKRADELLSHAQAAFKKLKYRKSGEIWISATKSFGAAKVDALGRQSARAAEAEFLVAKEAIDKALLDEFGDAEWKAAQKLEESARELQETGFNWDEAVAEYKEAGAAIPGAMSAAYARKVEKHLTELLDAARGVLTESRSEKRPLMDALDGQLGILNGFSGGEDYSVVSEQMKADLTTAVNGMTAEKARFSVSDIEPVEGAKMAPLKLLAEGSKEAQSKQQAAVSSTGAALEVQTLRAGVEMRLIPAGSFTMGMSKGREGRAVRDETRRKVTISQPFYMGKYEVTQDQWRRVMGLNPSEFQTSGSVPVNNVSWDEIQNFMAKLHEFEKVPAGTFRLVSEAEWEYACRAGTATPTCYGDSLDATRANFDGSQPYGKASVKENRKRPIAVGSFYPNAWGLHDMHGNVSEWVSDGYAPYIGTTATDPAAPVAAKQVIRGGSFVSSGESCRSSDRDKAVSAAKYTYLGFRIARKVPKKK